MAQVEKRIAFTGDIDNGQGELFVDNEVPDGWADFLGAHATLQTQQGWAANVIWSGTNPDRLTVRCLRRNGSAIEPVPQGQSVTVLLTLVGED
jgi:hypothetical protein